MEVGNSMPTIKDSLYFNYNGVSSRDYGLIHITTGNSMFEDVLVGSREILETKSSGSDTPNFNRISSSPIEFDMDIAFENNYSDKDIDDIVMWLFQDGYKELYFEDKSDKLFYCTPVGDPRIIHNGLQQGYITIRMRCNSPYVYSHVYLSEAYDLSTNVIRYPVTIENRGHFTLYPEISITKIGAGHITITDKSNGGVIFEIRDLTNLEKIYINSQKEIIETDILGVYRYGNVIGKYMKFPYGKNNIEVEGKCIIQFRYQYKFKF